MTKKRGASFTRSIPQRRQHDEDDLGFPVEGDPRGFVCAFAAIARKWDAVTARPLRQREWEATPDDLGFPVESDPGDLACAFLAVRGR
jgi:hypothetical protein